MYFSKYNIFSKIKNSEHYYLVNILTGNADIVDPDKAKEILSETNIDDELITKGYFTDVSEEKKLYVKKYLEFTESREQEEVQIFYVPWYSCNFKCSYCYQSGYENDITEINPEAADAFFNYIKDEFGSRKKYITIFGGEPLLTGKKYKEHISYILKRADENNIDVAIVTNGYALEEYIELFKGKKIREIQVTLDGTEDIHNVRRPLIGGSPTFEKIIAGIDAALGNNININLRVVLDKENISSLPGLSKYAIVKGWTKSSFFKTQLGRNYELHYCQSSSQRLYTRIEFYEALYSLLKQYPEIAEFHRPAFSISKFLFDRGSLPEPLFDACTGCKTEWAFDYTGNIYSCTATVGKQGESLGTFYPTVTKKEELIELWQERDVVSIDECKSCNLQLACGGGCAAVAFNKSGKLHSPDCRPVEELLSMGISHYFRKELEDVRVN